jgi:hypothetical protein
MQELQERLQYAAEESRAQEQEHSAAVAKINHLQVGNRRAFFVGVLAYIPCPSTTGSVC